MDMEMGRRVARSWGVAEWAVEQCAAMVVAQYPGLDEADLALMTPEQVLEVRRSRNG